MIYLHAFYLSDFRAKSLVVYNQHATVKGIERNQLFFRKGLVASIKLTKHLLPS
jgi:hypothetical protein